MDTPQTTNKAQTLRAEIEGQVKHLAQLTTEAARSEAMKNYLETCARFHHYSPNNMLLILLARPDASQVAGFNSWKKFSRWVKRGEHGIPILAPCLAHEDPDDQGSPMVLRGFRVVYVFDISQTEGQPLPPTPDWKSATVNQELQVKLILFASSKGIIVEVKQLQGSTQGVSSGGRITLSPEAGTKTLIHEVAHELMHRGEDRAEYTREDKELEAEAVAFVVGMHFRLSDLASPNYLALWCADEKKILARMDRIRNTATEIIRAVEPETQYLED